MTSLLALTILAQRPRAAAPPPVGQVILAAFDAWDADHDGLLTSAEVRKAGDDPQNRGAYGAALTALSQWKEICGEMPPLTKAWLRDYRPVRRPRRSGGEAPTLEDRRAAWEHGAALQNHFVAALDRIRSAPHDLYIAPPALEDVQQGGRGDCGDIAALGAFLVAQPDAVRRMIRPDGSGYSVTYADGMTVHVPLTDAEIGQSGASLAHGLWVVVLQDAFGLRDAYDAVIHPKVENSHNKLSAEEAYTGHKFRIVHLFANYRKIIAAEKLEAVAEEVRKAVADGTTNRRVMEAFTPPNVPPSIVGGHAYAVLGYQPSSDLVELWNPWGHNNGGIVYKGEHGTFWLPMRDFVSTFTSIVVETDKPFFEGKAPPTIPHTRQTE